MLSDTDALLRAGYVVQWAAPMRHHVDRFSVSLLDPSRVQVVVEVAAPAQEPQRWAAALAELLLTNEPDTWKVTFRGNFEWPATK